MILNLGLQAGYLRQNYSAEKKKCFKFNKCPSHTPRSIPDYAGRKEKEKRKERERERPEQRRSKGQAVCTCSPFSVGCEAPWTACSSPTGSQQRQRRHRGEKTGSDSRSATREDERAHRPLGRNRGRAKQRHTQRERASAAARCAQVVVYVCKDGVAILTRG